MPLIRKGAADANAPAAADVEQVLTALRSGNVDARWNAARALATDTSAVAALDQALTSETDARVREAIFTSLARIGAPEAADAVIAHLRSDDADMRTGALDALRAMIAAVRPLLPALLADPDPDVRILCCDLVRELSSADAVGLLGAVLDADPEPNVCAAAVDVLAEVGDAGALPHLARCAARFPDQSFVTFAVRIAHDRITAERAEPHG